ncbi:MAG: hypothetical protein A2511_01570 [Deltaproteobacteria bacterium RIFOXYD12_FULL_50_9]|nr:MAG: hypothetical protein A2511_01570 [Deltaproteobacteria bacterium RIFOXYD12_FULL_50_9]
MKIKTKLIILILAAVTLPMLAIGVLDYIHAKNALKEAIFEDLKLIAQSKEAAVLEYLEGKKQRTVDFASGDLILNQVAQIIAKSDPDERKMASKTLNEHLSRNKKPIDRDILEIHILDLAGRIIASTDKESLGSDRDKNQPYFLKGMSETYIQSPYVHELHGVRHLFIPVASPVKDLNNKTIGVLINGFDLTNIVEVMSGARSLRLGNTTPPADIRGLDILLFNHNQELLASTRETTPNSIRPVKATKPVLACLNGSEEINGEWSDHRDVPIWGASACIQAANDWKMVLVVKKDREEAIASIVRLRNLSIGVGSIALLLAALAALLVVRTVTKPIQALHRGTEIIAGGNLDHRVGTKSKDETGQLSRAFDVMMDNLKTMTASRDDLNKEIIVREQAEEKLLASEKSYRRLFETAKDGILLLDADTGQITGVNPYLAELLGYSKNEIIGRTLWDIGPFKDIKASKEAFSLLQEEEFIRYEDLPIETEDGRQIDVEFVSNVYSVGNKKVIQCNIRNITDRKHLNELLQDSEERYRRLFETAKDGLLLVDKTTGRIITVNPAIVEMLGCTAEDIDGKLLMDIGLLNDRLDFKEIMQQLQKTGFIHYEDVPVETREGKRIDTEVYLIDRAKLMQCNVRDVTVRRQLETFIKNILESVDEGFLVIDKDYRIISANRAYCEYVNSPHCDIVGRTCHEVAHHRDRPCFLDGAECAPAHTWRTGMPFSTLHTHYDLAGNPIYMETKSFAVRNSAGEITAVIETLNNVTEKRTIEEQLRHAQKMEAIGTLAGGIAHDFNNVLNVIIGYGGLIQMGMKADDPALPQLKEILAAGEKAAQLTKGLLLFSRKQVLELKTVNINELIDGFKTFLGRILGEDIKLRIKKVDASLLVMADQGHLEQVLMNLCANSHDAMPKGGILTIETKAVGIDPKFIEAYGYGESGEYALISVTDTGCGMDEKTRARIFEPYFTTKEIGRGTGLGLSIVFGIVKQHRGFIHCSSEPGKGTTFEIYLPLAKKEVVKLEVPAAFVPPGGTEIVLVAEDDPAVRNLTRTVLENFGYRVIEAVDGVDAVIKFKENKDRIRLLVLDMLMPGKDGREAYEDIKKIRPDIRVLFLSGYTADILQGKGILKEGMEFIAKPVLVNEFLQKVREVLDKAG